MIPGGCSKDAEHSALRAVVKLQAGLQHTGPGPKSTLSSQMLCSSLRPSLPSAEVSPSAPYVRSQTIVALGVRLLQPGTGLGTHRTSCTSASCYCWQVREGGAPPPVCSQQADASAHNSPNNANHRRMAGAGTAFPINSAAHSSSWPRAVTTTSLVLLWRHHQGRGHAPGSTG